MRLIQGQECDFALVEDAESLAMARDVVKDYSTIGFDTETMVTLAGGVFTDPYSCNIRLLQLGFHDRDPIIIDNSLVDPTMPLGGGSSLMDVLSTKELVAHNAPYDYKQVKVSLGVSLRNLVCSKVGMQSLALASGYKSGRLRTFSYLAMCRDMLGVRVDKTMQVSNWGAPVLSNAQYEYAALDVGAPRNRKHKSLLLQSYSLLRKESDRLGMGKVWDLRQALVPIVGDMELHGLLIDEELLSELQEAVVEQVSTSTKSLCELLGLEVFSSLDMLADGTWGIVTKPSPKSAKLLNHKTGLLSYINRELAQHGVELSDLQEDTLKAHLGIPLVAALAQYGMYYRLLGDVDKYKRVANVYTGSVHFQTNIIGTSTGRMSGSSEEGATDKLSVQTMSGKEVELKDDRKLSLRGCVKAKPNTVLLDLDFAAQELRIAAALSNDKVMLNTFFTERDNSFLIHPETGKEYPNPMTDLHLVATMNMGPYAYLKDVPLWEVAKACRVKGSDGKAPRDSGKTFNFSVVYGASAVSVAQDLGVTQKEAEGFLKDYFKNFSGLKKWMDKQSSTATSLRWLELPMGAQIFVNEVNAKGSGDKGAIARRAGNIPIQGTGAIMMALAIKYQSQRLGDKLRHLAFIYDGMLCEIPIPEGEEMKDGEGNWSPYVLGIQKEAKQCLLDAENDILSPYIGQPFPCAADSKLSQHWSH